MAQLDRYLQLKLHARHLRLVVAIDDFGNLKEVADISHVTVPAVSKALAELEKGLGLELFTRTSQGLKVNAYGEVVVDLARGMLTEIHKAREILNAMSSGSNGKIHVGVYPASSSVLLPQALALLKERSPGTNVQVTEGTSSILLPKLLQGEIDMVVGRLPKRNTTSGLNEKILMEDPLRLMAGSHHPLVRLKKLTWSHLQSYPWVLPPAGSLLRDPLEQTIERHGLTLSNNYIETSSVHVARAYLSISNAIGVMTGLPADSPSLALSILPLTMPNLIRPAGVLWNRERHLSPSAELMMACLEDTAKRLSKTSDNK